MPEGVEANDEGFDPRRGPIYVRGTGAEPKRKVISWLPTRGVNRRLDYVRRLLAALGSQAKPEEVLEGCWKFLTGLRDGWLESSNDAKLGVLYQVDHTWLRLEPVGPDDRVFECERCRRESPRVRSGGMHDAGMRREAGAGDLSRRRPLPATCTGTSTRCR